MKNIVAMVLLSLCFVGFQSGRSDFSGDWKLDLKKSTHLPGSFQSVDSYVMHIQQTKDSMITSVDMVGSGQHVTFPLVAYGFDGKEIFREDTLRGSKRWSKSTWATTGRKLVIESRVEQKRKDILLEYTQRDVWQLNDSKTIQLSVTQHYPKGDSTRSEKRIFRRVK